MLSQFNGKSRFSRFTKKSFITSTIDLTDANNVTVANALECFKINHTRSSSSIFPIIKFVIENVTGERKKVVAGFFVR